MNDNEKKQIKGIYKKISETKFWAEHIVNKFGSVIAVGFASSAKTCPCEFTGRLCYECYYSINGISCPESRKFYEFVGTARESYKIRMKRLDAVKRKIIFLQK
jgi:hypothetical protein